MQNESLSLKACRLVYTFLKFVAFVDVTWHAEQNARLFCVYFVNGWCILPGTPVRNTCFIIHRWFLLL